MTESRTKCALTGLQWTLGIVVLIESVLFVMPGSRQAFAHTHMPDIVRQVLGWVEIIGAILLLIPQTAARGGWMLVAIFLAAILLHVLHGMFNVGGLAVYTAAAWAVATGKTA